MFRMRSWLRRWFRMDFSGLTSFTFDVHCPNLAALTDYYIVAYYVKPLTLALNAPIVSPNYNIGEPDV